jgi:hypothetical protein
MIALSALVLAKNPAHLSIIYSSLSPNPDRQAFTMTRTLGAWPSSNSNPSSNHLSETHQKTSDSDKTIWRIQLMLSTQLAKD